MPDSQSSTVTATLAEWEDGIDLVIDTVVPVPAPQAWAAIADPAACADWFAAYTRDGDDITFEFDDGPLPAEVFDCGENTHALIDVKGLGRLGLALREAESGTRILATHTFAHAAQVAAAVEEIGPVWETHLRLLAEHLGHPTEAVTESAMTARYSELAQVAEGLAAESTDDANDEPNDDVAQVAAEVASTAADPTTATTPETDARA